MFFNGHGPLVQRCDGFDGSLTSFCSPRKCYCPSRVSTYPTKVVINNNIFPKCFLSNSLWSAPPICCCICVFEQWRHCFTNLRLLSGAPSLVEVRQLFLLQYFADFPHTRVNMFALQNSTNTTKNFQNTNYPFTSHSIGERSPKVSIWRVKHIKHHHGDFVKTTNQVNKWYLWIQNLGFLARPPLMHCFREKNHEQEQCFPIFVVKLWQRIG